MSNPQQLLSAAVGGVVGFFVGGPGGALYGLQIGLTIGSIVWPTQLPGVEGPRLEDFETLQADPGAPVPIGWGRFAVSGFRMYLGDEPSEVSHTEEVGGKGGPTQDVTTFEYFQTIAIGLCEGPIDGVTRIWENGTLVYDVRAQSAEETEEQFEARLEMSEKYAETFVLYLGDEEQMPDPTLELEQGEGNVPAFRGLAYIVYPDRKLQDEQGRRHPIFKFEIGKPAVKPEWEQVVINGDPPPGSSGNFTWQVPEGVFNLDYVLLVGSGGRGDASGGGAGEVLLLENVEVEPGQLISGRVGNPSSRDTLFGDHMARAGGDSPGQHGQAGNSGGSGSGGTSTSTGGAAGGASTAVAPGLGSPGGSGTGEPATNSRASGGGGGAGEAGGDATIVGGIGIPGKGGNGVYLGEIFGDDVGDQGWFGGGGGGGVSDGGRDIDPPAGGLGGGGRGVVSSNDNDGNGYDGMPNTGGGGGGGIGNFSGASGGAGVIIVRYKKPVLQYRVVTDVGPFAWRVPYGVTSADVLLVAGGGGGGASTFGSSNIVARGGGGAGGVLKELAIPVTPGSIISGYVGAGGAGGIADNPQTTGLHRGRNGENTTFGAFAAIGGGGGGPALETGTSDGADGGSGGGAGFRTNLGGEGVDGQGNDGGDGPGSGGAGGGAGGGGAAAAGGNILADTGAVGGAGYTLADLGFGGAVTHGAPASVGGGGGGGRFSGTGGGGAGGLGGGGAGGAASFGAGANGSPNTGGGGGGSGGGSGTNSVAGQKGGNGGSGLAIIRWISNAPDTAATVGEIVTDVCARVGLTSIDVAELGDAWVDGYLIAREMDALSALQPLRMVGLFDIVESGETVRFPVRGAAPVATLALEELGAHEETDEPGPLVITRKAQDYDLPRQVRFRYSSLARDYERGEQLSPARIGTVGVHDVTIECPVILPDDRAAQIAEILHRDAWISRWSYEVTLDQTRHALEPADVVLLPVDGRLVRARIVRIQDRALTVRRAELVRDDDGAYVSTAIASTTRRPSPTLVLLGDTAVDLLDLPALKEEHDDAGFYGAAHRIGLGTTWRGARLLKSYDAGATFGTYAGFATQAVTGRVLSAPTDGDGYTWDNQREYVVELDGGELESRTDAAVLAGANAAAVGKLGRWHIVQFANAELIGTRRYRLTRLLLGRRGTEYLIPTVEPGDQFVLLSGPGIYRLPMQTSEVGAERTYRVVTAGKTEDTENFTFTGKGQALMPFAPAHPKVEVDEGTADVTISWIRRDRLGQTLRDGVETPLSEDEEAYEVDILADDLSVVRTIETSTTSVVYTAAEQVSDFGGLVPDPKARIYQLSATVGRGIPREVGGGANLPSDVIWSAAQLRLHVHGNLLIGHARKNDPDNGPTVVHASNVLTLEQIDARAALGADGFGTQYADVIVGLHLYDGYVWIVGWQNVGHSISGPWEGKFWRLPYSSTGFVPAGDETGGEITAIDVHSPAAAAGLGNELYVYRQRTTPTPEAHILRIDLDTLEVLNETAGGASAMAVTDDAVYVSRVGNGIFKYSRDLSTSTSIPETDFGHIVWDDDAGQLYALNTSRLAAFDADLQLLWEVDFDETAIAAWVQNYREVAIDVANDEVLVAMIPLVTPPQTNQLDIVFVGRFSRTDGSFIGKYMIRGAIGPVLVQGGALYVNTLDIVYLPFNQFIETRRLERWPAAALADVAT